MQEVGSLILVVLLPLAALAVICLIVVAVGVVFPHFVVNHSSEPLVPALHSLSLGLGSEQLGTWTWSLTKVTFLAHHLGASLGATMRLVAMLRCAQRQSLDHVVEVTNDLTKFIDTCELLVDFVLLGVASFVTHHLIIFESGLCLFWFLPKLARELLQLSITLSLEERRVELIPLLRFLPLQIRVVRF